MSWLRRLAAYLPPTKPRIDPRSFHAWFVGDTLTLGAIFPPKLLFSRFLIILPMVRIHSLVPDVVKLKNWQHLQTKHLNNLFSGILLHRNPQKFIQSIFWGGCNLKRFFYCNLSNTKLVFSWKNMLIFT